MMRDTFSLVISLLLACGLATSCGGAEKKEDDRPGKGKGKMVGAPPAPKDDPFFFVAMPAEAVPADTSGKIGPDEGEPPAAKATTSEPDEPPPSAPSGSHQCFSCVRLCAEEDEECDEDDDVICGWGVHPDREDAMALATGECNGALDMARQMPQWKRIDGDCPAATCR